jgi:hypothetical protein
LLDLIVSSNDTFDGADSRYLMTEGTSYYFVEVNISDGEFVSFVLVRSTKSPGGVFTGLEIWFKGDSVVTASLGTVSSLVDQTYGI